MYLHSCTAKKHSRNIYLSTKLMRKSSFTDPAKASHCPLLRSTAALAIPRQRCSGTVVEVMSMRRHSKGSPTATLRHAVQAQSAPRMISWQGPSLRKTSTRMSRGSLSHGERRTAPWVGLCNLFSQFKATVILDFIGHQCRR
jgi:hypothetical protein